MFLKMFLRYHICMGIKYGFWVHVLLYTIIDDDDILMMIPGKHITKACDLFCSRLLAYYHTPSAVATVLE